MIEWFKGAFVFLILLLTAFGLLWSNDPTQSVKEIQGSIVSWGGPEAPNSAIRYYKMLLLVQTDDGRRVGVLSERRTAPVVSERIAIQERLGWLGTESFVEIPPK